MAENDKQDLLDEAYLRGMVARLRRRLHALELALAEYGPQPTGERVKPLIEHIEVWLEKHGPATREEIVIAMLEQNKVRAQRDQAQQVQKSIDRGLLPTSKAPARLVEKHGKICLP